MHVVIAYSTEFLRVFSVKGYMESEVTLVLLSPSGEFHTSSLVETYIDPEVVLVLLWSMIENQAFFCGTVLLDPAVHPYPAVVG